ncbi:PD-(D/E)XK nuclease family protein [Adlercreutzia sp. ZJ138]|uniref:PDDEXK-like family protein n=1 Tax=Adlercreutzia sp. ZJ138 TaxID=2709405 RepID=UPI0013ECD1A9|nr:PD-(D/E)XK nuclease family protein [Adlercreutzia sp. ZJ138]
MNEELSVSEDVSENDDTRALKEFLLDIDCLNPLDEWADHFNLFDVLGIARTEIRHSNVLGWLLNPNENHGLGDAVVRGFLTYIATAGYDSVDIFDALLLDCQDFTVWREWRSIDILVVSAKERYVMCIENKIGTSEHDDQLNRYRRIVESQYPQYRHAYIYLSPNGVAPSDPQHWCAMSYRVVLDIIEVAKTKNRLLPDVELLIDNYIETIRRDVVGDERLEQICEEIYSKHRRALDLIYEHRPDKASSLTAIIRAWAEQRDSAGQIILDRSKCNKTYTRFTTPGMTAALPNANEPNSAWSTRNHYFYEVVNNEGERFNSWISLSHKGADAALLSRFESLFKHASSYPNRANWAYHVPFSTADCIVDEEMSEDEIFQELDKQLEKLMKFEARIAPLVIEDTR